MSAPSQPKSELPSNPSTQPENGNTSIPTTTTSNGTSQNGNGAGAGAVGRKTEAEEAADRLYEERIEEEYAKREGGA
ncbi:hypothetical protein IFR05_004705 [Cadophora sp. M221]|nr:hypothetical protein IFR05_004705 [Cadophora sp. M221]